ncbi:MAG: M23 family metallopeptidase [Armatimonadota bacterium]|nr:M23 family metallopeptidase [Armatimonadota bacterium]
MRTRSVLIVLAATVVLAPSVPAAVEGPPVAGDPAPISFVKAVRSQARRDALLASAASGRPAPAVPAGIRVAQLSAAVLPVDADPAAPPSSPRLAGLSRDPRRLPSRGGRASLVASPLQWPATGDLSSFFGLRWNAQHRGIDIAASPGAPIFAARSGRVVLAGWYGGYGLTVIVDHGRGYQTLYAHASAVLVRPGQQVRAGQLIARVGSTGVSTGPHLHFEFRVNGRPVNPLRYL